MKFLRNITLPLAVIAVAIAGATPVLAQKAAAPTTKKAKAPKSTAKKTKAKKSTAKAATQKAKPAAKEAAASKTAKPKSRATKKTASACAGLARGQCSAKKECGWITPKKKVSSNGRKCHIPEGSLAVSRIALA